MRKSLIVRRLGRDETGATSTEYALLVALIAIVIFASVSFFGGTISDSFRSSCSSMAQSVC